MVPPDLLLCGPQQAPTLVTCRPHAAPTGGLAALGLGLEVFFSRGPCGTSTNARSLECSASGLLLFRIALRVKLWANCSISRGRCQGDAGANNANLQDAIFKMSFFGENMQIYMAY